MYNMNCDVVIVGVDNLIALGVDVASRKARKSAYNVALYALRCIEHRGVAVAFLYGNGRVLCG